MDTVASQLRQRQMPELYSQEEQQDPMVQAMLIGSNGWVWGLTEYSAVAPDETPDLAFGWVSGDEDEWGYVSIAEVDQVNAQGGGKVWVQQDFVPCRLSEFKPMAKGVRRMIEATGIVMVRV